MDRDSGASDPETKRWQGLWGYHWSSDDSLQEAQEGGSTLYSPIDTTSLQPKQKESKPRGRSNSPPVFHNHQSSVVFWNNCQVSKTSASELSAEVTVCSFSHNRWSAKYPLAHLRCSASSTSYKWHRHNPCAPAGWKVRFSSYPAVYAKVRTTYMRKAAPHSFISFEQQSESSNGAVRLLKVDGVRCFKPGSTFSSCQPQHHVHGTLSLSQLVERREFRPWPSDVCMVPSELRCTSLQDLGWQ